MALEAILEEIANSELLSPLPRNGSFECAGLKAGGSSHLYGSAGRKGGPKCRGQAAILVSGPNTQDGLLLRL